MDDVIGPTFKLQGYNINTRSGDVDEVSFLFTSNDVQQLKACSKALRELCSLLDVGFDGIQKIGNDCVVIGFFVAYYKWKGQLRLYLGEFSVGSTADRIHKTCTNFKLPKTKEELAAILVADALE